jgi:hypothetical protein
VERQVTRNIADETGLPEWLGAAGQWPKRNALASSCSLPRRYLMTVLIRNGRTSMDTATTLGTSPCHVDVLCFFVILQPETSKGGGKPRRVGLVTDLPDRAGGFCRSLHLKCRLALALSFSRPLSLPLSSSTPETKAATTRSSPKASATPWSYSGSVVN